MSVNVLLHSSYLTPYCRPRTGQWYAHIFITTLVCDWPMPEGAENAVPIQRRGWCIFEKALSTVCKHGGCCLALSQLPERATGSWGDLVKACKVGRPPPLSPDDFEALLREGMKREAAEAGAGFTFTNGKDATNVCIPQYREGFLRLMAAGGKLIFSRCGWCDAQVQVLAAALVYAQAHGATTRADKLSLSFNKLTSASLPPLVSAMAMGVMPELKVIGLGRNCELGDAGAVQIAGMLSQGLPKLEELYLDYTGMGDEGATALAGALGGAPKLQKLVVEGNAIGERCKELLTEACAKQGINLRVLSRATTW